jgi:hypothetical protein
MFLGRTFSGIHSRLSGGSTATYLENLQPLICKICSCSSGGSAAAYLEDLQPLIWGSAAASLVKWENKAKLSPAEAGAWPEVGNSGHRVAPIGRTTGTDKLLLLFI